MKTRYCRSLWVLSSAICLAWCPIMGVAQEIESSDFPSLTKIFIPDTIGPGSTATLELTITNGESSTEPVEALAFTDNLPDGMTLASPALISNSCFGTLSAPSGGSAISLSNVSLGATESCTISLNVTASEPGVVTNTTSMLTGNTLTGEGFASPAATSDLNVDQSLPGFSKSFSPAQITRGERTTLTLTIDNSFNESVVGSLDFTDILPNGVIIASPANASTDCVGLLDDTTLTAIPGSSTIVLDANGASFNGFEVLPAGATCTVVVDVIGTAVGALANITEDLKAEFIAAGKAAAVLEVSASEGLLALSKEFTSDPALTGATTILEFTVSNRSRAEAATDISFTDDLDATLTGLAPVLPLLPTPNPACGPGSSVEFSGGVLTFAGGSLPPEGSCTFKVELEVPAASTEGSYPNTAGPITGLVGGNADTGNSASDLLFVSNFPILTKTFVENPIGAGDTVTLSFTITNSDSTSDISDITFQDELTDNSGQLNPIGGGFLPFPVSVTLPPVPSPPCGPDSSLALIFVGTDRQALELTGGALAAGDSCTFTVDIAIPDSFNSGIYTNTTRQISATVASGTQVGPGASDQLQVLGAPTLRKSFTNDPVAPDSTATLEFTLSNLDTVNTAEAIAFTDTLNEAPNGLPDGLMDSVISNTCNGTVTGVGTNTFGLSGATLPPEATCIIEIGVSVPAGTGGGEFHNPTSQVSAIVAGIAALGRPAEDTLVVAGLLLNKQFIEDTTIPGDNVTLRFTLDNTSGSVDANNIFFTDDLTSILPGTPDLTVNTTLPLAACGGTISGSGVLLFNGGQVLANETCEIDIELAVPAGVAGGAYRNTTSVVTSSVGESPAATDLLSLSSRLIQIEKSFIDGPAAPGDLVNLQFTLTNLSALDAVTSIAFEDDLKAALDGMQVTGMPSNGCGGTSSTVFPADIFEYADGNLSEGGTEGSSCTIEITAQIPAGPLDGSVFSNTTSDVSGTTRGFAVFGDSATATLEVDVLTLSKSFAGPTTATGTQTMTFTIENLNAATGFNGLAFTDDLTAVIPGLEATTFPTDPCGSGSIVSGTSFLSLTNASLPAGDSCSFDVAVTAPDTATAGTFTNVTSELFLNGLKAADPASAELTIEPAPGISLALAPNEIDAGGVSTATLTIDNSASSLAASSLNFGSNLPAGLQLAAPSGASTTCSGGAITANPGSSSITYTAGTVDAGASCAVSFDITSTLGAAALEVKGALTSSAGDSGEAAATLSLKAVVPPTFDKAFTPDNLTVTSGSVLTLSINNVGSLLAATGLNFTDNLPAGLIVADPANASTTCTGGTLTAANGSSSISYSGGSVPASGSCSVQVDVLANSAGGAVNTTGELTSSAGNSGTASATLTVNPAEIPAFTKAFSPTEVTVGTNSAVTFTINNSTSDVDATGLNFTDNLPAGLVVADPANASTTCTGGTLTAANGSSSISYSGGSVPASGSCSVQVDVLANSAGGAVNTTGELTSSAGNSGTASATLTVNPAEIPAFTKAFSPTEVTVGTNSAVTFTINNSTSDVDATGLNFTDNLPAGLVVADPANASTTCTGGTLTAANGSSSISYSGGSVPASGSCSVQVDVLANSAGGAVNTTGELTSSAGNSGTASATLTVNPAEIPAFTKAFSPTEVTVGTNSAVTFTINNSTSDVDATGLNFTDNLPAGLVVADPANASTTCTGGTLTAANGSSSISYSGGTVATGTSCTVQVDVATTAAGLLANTTSNLTSSAGDSGTASATLTVNAAVLPGLTKAFAPSTVDVGEISSLTLTIDNSASSVAADSLAITDTFPEGMQVASPANSGTTCTGGTLTAEEGSDTLSYSGGTVAAGASCTLQVDVTTTAAGLLANTTSNLTSSAGDSGTASATLTVNAAVLPGLTKAFAPSTVDVGEISSLTLTIDNSASSVAADSLAITDTFPEGMQVASPANSGTTCTGGTLTAEEGSDTLSYSGGTVAAGASCTLQVDVTTTAAGLLANTTSNLTSSAGDSGTASATLTVNAGVLKREFTGNLPSGTEGTISFTTTDTSCTFVSDPQFLDESGISPAPPETLDLLDGVASFVIENCTPGASVEVTIDYGQTLETGSIYWKAGNPWYSLATEVSGSTIVFSITDGELGDTDEVANGTIVDPGGAGIDGGVAPKPVPVPIMNLVMLMAMAAMLVLLGAYYLCRRRQGRF